MPWRCLRGTLPLTQPPLCRTHGCSTTRLSTCSLAWSASRRKITSCVRDALPCVLCGCLESITHHQRTRHGCRWVRQTLPSPGHFRHARQDRVCYANWGAGQRSDGAGATRLSARVPPTTAARVLPATAAVVLLGWLTLHAYSPAILSPSVLCAGGPHVPSCSALLR